LREALGEREIRGRDLVSRVRVAAAKTPEQGLIRDLARLGARAMIQQRRGRRLGSLAASLASVRTGPVLRARG
jgi:hypothetical protein